MVLGLVQENSKLNKVPITTLHFKNVPLSDYIDDFFTKGDTFSICEENIQKKCVCATSWVLSQILKSPKLFRHKELES